MSHPSRCLAMLFALGIPASAVASPGTAHPSESPIQPRIIGGTDTPADAYPFYVSLRRTRPEDDMTQHFCGGTLISPSWVLTAAHCVNGIDTAGHAVLVGPHDRQTTSSAIRRNIHAVHIAPDYNLNGQHQNDIALLRLDRPVEGIRPVSVVTFDTSVLEAHGTPMRTIGWGYNQEQGTDRPRYVQHVDVPFVAMDVCRSLYQTVTPEEPLDFLMTNMCAGSRGIGACDGDSGGPLMIDAGARGWLQLGVFSQIYRAPGERSCRKVGIPDFYARINDDANAAFIETTWTRD